MHTPGPWKVFSEGNDLWVTNSKGNKGLCSLPKKGDRSMDNANLMAAAPDLLEALEDMCGVWRTVCDTNGHDPDHMCQYTKAMKLIGKIKKGTQ